MWSRVVIALVVLSLAAGCRKAKIEYGEGETVTIAYLKSLYERSPVTIDGEVYIEGRVVSTDQYGNFYNTLFVEDATGGIPIRIDLKNYYHSYFRGMEVRVACNSLVLSSYGGMLQLGAYVRDEDSQSLGYIPSDRLLSVIFINEKQDAALVPVTLTIGALSPPHIGRHVAFRDVQFENPLLKWADAEADTDRYITDRNGARLAVRTSRYAEFANRSLPAGSGYIEGVLTYFNGNYQLVVCSDIYAVMEGKRF